MSETPLADKQLSDAIEKESQKFQSCYLWLKNNMPRSFFEEVPGDLLNLVTHSLSGLDLQQYSTQLHLKQLAIALCLDSPDADLRILQNFSMQGIKNYRSFVSKTPPPIPGAKANLRIATIYFTEALESVDKPFPEESQIKLKEALQQKGFEVSDEEFSSLMKIIHPRFLLSLQTDLLALAIKLLSQAKKEDHCQYEVTYNKDWQEKELPSMQIVLAWRNIPKQFFLYRLAKVIHRYGLVIKRVNATYVNPYSKESTLVMALGLDGAGDKAAWEAANADDFLKELISVKYFAVFDLIEQVFIESSLTSACMGELIRSSLDFIHQILVNVDLHLYTHANCEEALCRHPELTVQLCAAFEAKFHPQKHDLHRYKEIRDNFLSLVDKLDTGNEINDLRRKNVLKQGMNFIDHILKTNFYLSHKTSLAFRLDPFYLDHAPLDREHKFPLLPYAIFFIRDAHFISFHIRFKDLARGGVRTVFPQQPERAQSERNSVFYECYSLAYTQNKKNKDIPEGGAKAVIFLKPFERLDSEAMILTQELQKANVDSAEITLKMKLFIEEQKLEYLHQSQRSFVRSLLSLINCYPDGLLKEEQIVDYWKKPEYIYLGPDENMHDSMIIWIAEYSKHCGYKPGGAFISGKPEIGINHKQYGVTSLGVNTYMHEVLKFLKIDPEKDPFTIKISGGPDGDVAGNQIHNLYRFYPQTAKLLALTDVSGTIFDPKGLDLEEMMELFQRGLPIRYYPPKQLSEGGYLLDLMTKQEQNAYSQQTLLWKKQDGKLIQDWLSGNEMNALFRSNVHSTKVDIFIPAGGRPRTLNDSNWSEFLDEKGKPTARAIIEGANLYLTPWARHSLENLGTLIVKDSSANKTGVICSSFEILTGLTLSEEQFLEHKPQLVEEILQLIKQKALDEALLLLNTHKLTNAPLSEISESISERINDFTDQLHGYLENILLPNDPHHPLLKCFLNYCPTLLREHYTDELLSEIPDNHKKAIIACSIASRLVYRKGLNWSPSLVDVLPLILAEVV